MEGSGVVDGRKRASAAAVEDGQGEKGGGAHGIWREEKCEALTTSLIIKKKTILGIFGCSIEQKTLRNIWTKLNWGHVKTRSKDHAKI